MPFYIYRGSYNQSRGNLQVFAAPDGGAASIVTTNLTHHFDAGNASSYGGSGTVWTNLVSGNPNIALVNGPTFVSNGAASYFRLDGIDDYMSGSGYALPVNNQTTIDRKSVV